MPTAMKMRPLGSSGLQVPIVCMGTMTMGEQNDDAESFAILDACMEAGVNFFDTAELYPVPPKEETTGRSEVIIGRWLKERGIARDKVILATKVAGAIPGLDRHYIVANRTDPPASGACGQPQLDAASIRAACEGSLRRLQTSYIDLYQIHWPSRYLPAFGKRQYRVESERDSISFEEQVEALGALIKEGKVLHWGVSNESSYGLTMLCETAKRLGVPPPCSIQNDYSLVYRGFDQELAETCSPRHCNVGLIPYGCLAGGTLSGKYLDGARPEGARHTKFPGFQPRYICKATEAATADYAALAKARGLTPTQLALGFVASRFFLSSIIIGATSLQQLAECVEGCNTDLDEETIAAIDKLYAKHGSTNYTD